MLYYKCFPGQLELGYIHRDQMDKDEINKLERILHLKAFSTSNFSILYYS